MTDSIKKIIDFERIAYGEVESLIEPLMHWLKYRKRVALRLKEHLTEGEKDCLEDIMEYINKQIKLLLAL